MAAGVLTVSMFSVKMSSDRFSQSPIDSVTSVSRFWSTLRMESCFSWPGQGNKLGVNYATEKMMLVYVHLASHQGLCNLTIQALLFFPTRLVHRFHLGIMQIKNLNSSRRVLLTSIIYYFCTQLLRLCLSSPNTLLHTLLPEAPLPGALPRQWSPALLPILQYSPIPSGMDSNRFCDRSKSVNATSPLTSLGNCSSLFSDTSRQTKRRRLPSS